MDPYKFTVDIHCSDLLVSALRKNIRENSVCHLYYNYFTICIKGFHLKELCKQLCHSSDTWDQIWVILCNKVFVVQITISEEDRNEKDRWRITDN